MMARKSRIEQLSVVADPWNLKLKPAKLKGAPLDFRNSFRQLKGGGPSYVTDIHTEALASRSRGGLGR